MTDSTYGPHTPAWAALEQRAAELSEQTIASLFQEAPDRGQTFATEAEGIYLDLSRQRLDEATRGLLLELAEQTQVRAWIQRMFSGEHVNNTEDRPALHVALRRPADRPLSVDGEDVMAGVVAERAKMRHLTGALEGGEAADHLLNVWQAEFVLREDLEALAHQHVVVGNVSGRRTQCVDSGALGEIDPDFGDQDPFEIETCEFQLLLPLSMFHRAMSA